LGVGGSAANSSHAVNDFRKLCGIEAYAPVDNVSELTARTNDEGWDTVFANWLQVSHANEKDAIFVLSVGGGNLEKNVSPNIVMALKYAKERNMKIFGVVGRDGGYTKLVGDCVIVVPTISESRITPHAEAFQAVVWHCLVCNPVLQQKPTKW
jgi:D-sedoheptulose 7-phosphate isomerase